MNNIKYSIKDNVNQIQNWLRNQALDMIIIPHDDEYLSEYVPPENERLFWATGFTGSAGFAIISQNKALIFVDGRYTVQIKNQVDNNLFEIKSIPQDLWYQWIKENYSKGTKIAYDPRMHRITWKKQALKQLGENYHLHKIDNNPIDLFWKNRPYRNSEKAILLDLKYAGVSSIDKRLELGIVITKNKCDAAFITQLDSIAWLLNIRGNDVPCNPILLCHGILYSDGSFELFIDKKKIPNGFSNHVGSGVKIFEPTEIKKQLKKLSGKRIQLDPNRSNVWVQNFILDIDAKIKFKDDPCILPKACKNKIEIQGMKKCHIRDATAVCRFLAWLDKKINAGNLLDEGTLSDKLDSFRSELDLFKGISFDTISASGKNAAMCHYNHKNQEKPGVLEMNSVYLVDSGGQYLDGTTDITRTIAVGNPNKFIKKTFTWVLKGHIALSLAQFPEGIAGQHVDTFARQFLWREGLDFNHGTGHGVGSYLNVHEGPHSIGKGSNQVPFKEGMVVSNEPGYYKENEFGIRSENLIYVKKIKEIDDTNLLGFENLTYVPFDTRLLETSLISDIEKEWINSYHKKVLDKIGPLLDPETLNWLIKAISPI